MPVFLLKNRSDDAERGQLDPYEQCIPGVCFVPIMDYHNTNLDLLVTRLSEPQNIDGIIVTSQRAVDALKHVLPQKSSDIFSIPIYTVGPTTARRLVNLGFHNVKGDESGSGSALAEAMVQDLPPSSRLLFLAGEVHRPLLPKRLTEAGHAVNTIIVYRTTPNANADTFLRNNVHDGDWVVFFSPSHTDQILKFLRDSPIRVNIAAIGPTTSDFLHQQNFKVGAVAPEPTAGGLKTAIDGYSSDGP